jgi:hypothetical protein
MVAHQMLVKADVTIRQNLRLCRGLRERKIRAWG